MQGLVTKHTPVRRVLRKMQQKESQPPTTRELSHKTSVCPLTRIFDQHFATSNLRIQSVCLEYGFAFLFTACHPRTCSNTLTHRPAPQPTARQLPSQNPQIPRTSGHTSLSLIFPLFLFTSVSLLRPSNSFLIVFADNMDHPVVVPSLRASVVAPPFAKLTLTISNQPSAFSLPGFAFGSLVSSLSLLLPIVPKVCLTPGS